MSGADDPTLASLADLDDTSKFVLLERAVPVFCPHARKVPGDDGQPQDVVVTPERLKRIVANAGWRERERGVLPRITFGHVQQALDFPEVKQPVPVGFGRNPQVGTFMNKVPAILYDLYVRREHAALARTFPFRSAEFFPNRDEITGIALLRRDPHLDLGMLTYVRPGGAYLYSLGDTMDPKLLDPIKAPVAHPPTTPPGDDDPDFKKFEGYLRKNKVTNYLLTKYAKEAEESGGPGDDNLPGGGADDPERKDKLDFQRTQEAVHYQRLQAKVDQLERDRDTQALNYARADSSRRVTKLLGLGVKMKDPNAEYLRMAAMKTDAERQAREEEMAENYQRDPTGRAPTPTGFLDIANLDGAPDKPGEQQPLEPGDPRFDQMVAYVREKGCSFDEAERHVRGQGKK